jgi:hypothetical protein
MSKNIKQEEHSYEPIFPPFFSTQSKVLAYGEAALAYNSLSGVLNSSDHACAGARLKGSKKQAKFYVEICQERQKHS